MLFFINSTFSFDIIAMAASIALVVWSLQIKAGKQLAMIGGVLLFILSVLSLSSTGFLAGKFILNGGSHILEHREIENMLHQTPKGP